jgi:hypothetical protein
VVRDSDIEYLSGSLGNLEVEFEDVAELEIDEMHVLSVLLKDVPVQVNWCIHVMSMSFTTPWRHVSFGTVLMW